MISNDSKKESIEVINLTPHAITMVRETETGLETVKVYKPSGFQARCVSKTEVIGSVNSVPITKTVFGEPCFIGPDGNKTPLPGVDEHTVYIVSALMARACNRPDFVITNESVRDENGRIVGCKSFGIV